MKLPFRPSHSSLPSVNYILNCKRPATTGGLQVWCHRPERCRAARSHRYTGHCQCNQGNGCHCRRWLEPDLVNNFEHEGLKRNTLAIIPSRSFVKNFESIKVRLVAIAQEAARAGGKEFWWRWLALIVAWGAPPALKFVSSLQGFVETEAENGPGWGWVSFCYKSWGSSSGAG